MRQLANLTILLNERGKGIWSNGKIHVRMQELDGFVYFGSFCEDNGPPAIDASSYGGPYWFRINMKAGQVEPLSKINSFWGLLGQAMDKQKRLASYYFVFWLFISCRNFSAKAGSSGFNILYCFNAASLLPILR